jgi:hypothetical protein
MNDASRSIQADQYEGRFYDTNCSTKTPCITVQIKSTTAFQIIKNALNERYTFVTNKNRNGVECRFTDAGKKVVLSLYNNQTLFIQGSGCWSWKSNVFSTVCQALDEIVMETNETKTLSESESEENYSTPIMTNSQSKSPLFYLSRMVSSIRNARSRGTPGQIEVHASRSIIQGNATSNFKSTPKGRSRDSSQEEDDDEVTFVKQLFHSRSSPGNESNEVSSMTDVMSPSRSTPVRCENYTQTELSRSRDLSQEEDDDEVTFVKRLFHSRSSPGNEFNEVSSMPDMTSPSRSTPVRCENYTQTESSRQHEAATMTDGKVSNTAVLLDSQSQTEPSMTGFKSHGTAEDAQLKSGYDKLSQDLAQQKKDNRELQESLKNLLGQSKVLKAESENLIKLIEDKESENKTLKSDLAEANSKVLIYEQDIANLKDQSDKLKKERSDLLDQLMAARGSSDTIEAKIDSSTESLETKVTNEVNELKRVLIKELDELKEQINKSKSLTTKPTTNDPYKTSEQMPIRTMISNRNDTVDPHSGGARRQADLSKKNDASYYRSESGRQTAFVAGDSITRILSAAKMSDNNLEVKIKSHPGGRVRTVENTVRSMLDKDPDYIKQLDAVLLHVGTNNVADSASSDSITAEFRETIDSIRSVNSKIKVVVSSIIPSRNDRMVNGVISRVNRSLQTMCEVKGYHFIDNDENFLQHSVPDRSLYRDNIHLNTKGGKVLGVSLRNALNNVLGIEVDDTTSENRQHFHNGRSSGRRTPNQNNGRMVFMPVPSYWLNNQNPWNVTNHPMY